MACKRSGLTPRSSGAPTAGHQARSGGTRYIFASPGLASCRRHPVNSNVGTAVAKSKRQISTFSGLLKRSNLRPLPAHCGHRHIQLRIPTRGLAVPQNSHPPSATIVQCDRALGRNARGGNLAVTSKNERPPRRTDFSRRACFRSKTAAHCAAAALGADCECKLAHGVCF